MARRSVAGCRSDPVALRNIGHNDPLAMCNGYWIPTDCLRSAAKLRHLSANLLLSETSAATKRAQTRLAPEVNTLDDVEVNRLCEELSALIELEPGVNADALSRARWAITALHSTKSGDYVNEKLVGLAYGFEQWFSASKWNRHDDGGKFVRQHLEDDLICLRAAMWRKSRGKGEP